MRDEPGVADAAGYRLITDVRSRAAGKAVDVVFAQPYPAWKTLFSDLLPAHLLKDAPGSWTGALDGVPASGGPFAVSVDRPAARSCSRATTSTGTPPRCSTSSCCAAPARTDRRPTCATRTCSSP